MITITKLPAGLDGEALKTKLGLLATFLGMPIALPAKEVDGKIELAYTRAGKDQAPSLVFHVDKSLLK